VKTWKHLKSLGLANANMNVEKPQVFRCGQCKYECRKGHIDSSSPEEGKLWQDITQATDAVCVTCPQCKEDLIQCRHCLFNLCKKDTETHSICTERKVSILYLGKEHVKKNHDNTDSVSEIQPKKKGEGDQRAKKEVGNPVMGVMWLTMGKVIFTPLLAAGASMSAGGVTLGKLTGPPGSSSQPRAKMLHR
jgi:hypothetical protein